MIDWVNLAFNTLWILACAISLAALSYASWQASLFHVKMRQWLKLPGYQVIFNLAAMLFCVGLAGLTDSLIVRILWIILAVLSLALAILTWKSQKAKQAPQNPSENT